MPVTPAALEILLILLPGFTAAYLVQLLATRAKQTDLEKIVEALLFSFSIYVSYSLIRHTGLPVTLVSPYFSGEDGDSLWELWLLASKSVHVLERCIQSTEPAYLAKYAFQLAQQFSNFYHRHHILTEADPARKALLLATAAITQRELIRALAWMGMEAPDVM